MVCFRAFLAVSVYYNIYKVEIAEVFNGPYLAYGIVTQFVIVGISLMAAIPGFLTQALGIKCPDMIANIFRDLGRCGTPVALIIMGGIFNFGAVKKNLKPIAVGVIFPGGVYLPLFSGSHLYVDLCAQQDGNILTW